MKKKFQTIKRGNVIFTKESLIAEKKDRLKKRKRRKFITLIISLILIISCMLYIKNIYINSKCTNILYAVDYYLTQIPEDEINLLRVKNFDILTLDKNYIHINARGLTKTKPHTEICIDAEFTRYPDKIWKLSKYSKVKTKK